MVSKSLSASKSNFRALSSFTSSDVSLQNFQVLFPVKPKALAPGSHRSLPSSRCLIFKVHLPKSPGFRGFPAFQPPAVSCPLSRALDYYIAFAFVCQALFSGFFDFFSLPCSGSRFHRHPVGRAPLSSARLSYHTTGPFVNCFFPFSYLLFTYLSFSAIYREPSGSPPQRYVRGKQIFPGMGGRFAGETFRA